MTQGIWQSSFCQVQTRDSEIHLFGWAVRDPEWIQRSLDPLYASKSFRSIPGNLMVVRLFCVLQTLAIDAVLGSRFLTVANISGKLIAAVHSRVK